MAILALGTVLLRDVPYDMDPSRELGEGGLVERCKDKERVDILELVFDGVIGQFTPRSGSHPVVLQVSNHPDMCD